MKKSALVLSLALGFVSLSVLAEQSKVSISKISLNKVLTSSIFEPVLENDGSIYNLSYLSDGLVNKDAVINKQLLDGKIVSTGKIPHPDIVNLNGENKVSFGVNKSGTIIVAYVFFNAQSKYQFVFYKFKNNQWTRLPDLLDKNTEISIKKIFVDDNENVIFSTTDNLRLYELQGSSWQLMDNLANNKKYDVFHEKIADISNGSVYTTRIDRKSNSFQAYKYTSNSAYSSDSTSLGQNEYVPSCSTITNKDTVVTAFVNNHDNLAKKSIIFQTLSINHKSDLSQASTGVSNNSLLGSIFSLGKAVTNLAGGNNGNESGAMVQSVTGQEIDVSNYNITQSDPQCISIGDSSYFLFKAYNQNGTGYSYYKIIVPNKSN